MATKIIIDTNFLLIPVVFKVDIFAEIERICNFPYELCVVEKTVEELAKIVCKGKKKDAIAARIGDLLIKEKHVAMLPMVGSHTVDDALVKYGKQGAIIATQDKDLKRNLKSLGVRCIVLRQKSFLLLEG